jgi:micrococcal nuclease
MYEYKVKEVLRIIDGDTIDVLIDLGFKIYVTQRVRLVGIDAPETRTKDLEEKKKGLASKEFVQRFLENAKQNNKEITIRTTIDDKYGRILGEISVDGVYINKLLLEKHLAFLYREY